MGSILTSHYFSWQNEKFTSKRWCSAPGGIRKELPITSFLNTSKQIMQIFIHTDWLDWVKLCRKCGLFQAKVRERYFYYMTTLDHMLQKHQGKDRELGLGSLASPGVFTRLSSILLSFVSVNAAFLSGKKLHRSWKHQKRSRFVFCL